MKRTKRILGLALALLLCTPMVATARAESVWTIDQGYYTVYGPDGGELFLHGGAIEVDDEYISGDNKLYRVTTVDAAGLTAQAEFVGDEILPEIVMLDDASAEVSNAGGNRTVGMYCTHSDESYIPGDGTASMDQKRGGIFDVAESLAGYLEKNGVTVKMDESTHYPHDAGAYRRSRATAAQLAKTMPAALIDVHRDGVPAKEYVTTVDGTKMTKVRLFVGRSNPNRSANRQFATQLKAIGDEMYPGLIKDIFIGKGNYNQELMPHAILLEFGTHESNKEQVLKSTQYMSDVLTKALFGSATTDKKGASSAAPENTSSAKGAGTGTGTSGNDTQNKQPTAQEQSAKKEANKASGASTLWWVLGIIVVIGVLTLAATGGKGFFHKLSRNTSEVTGGLIGKDKDDDNHRDP